MAIVQVSKIQMRRGFEIDIPGKPATLSPLTFEPGLDIGEIGYASDTGRLFVGHNPNSGHINYQRSSFPYQNIEVLTENSTETIGNIFNLNHRNVTNGFYHATLGANKTDPTDVLVDRSVGSATVFRFDGGEVLARIEYFVFGAANAPLRQGTLRIISESGQENVIVDDTYIRSPQVVAQTSALADPDQDEFMTFSLKRAGGEVDPHLKLQYTSLITTQTRLYFSLQRPMP